jgi:hypothetical protein
MLLNTWELVNTWNIPEVVSDEVSPTGGWIYRWEEENRRRSEEAARRAKDKKKALKIKKQLDRELALAERAIEEEEARRAELARINRLAAEYQDEIISIYPKMERALTEALERQTYSTMERLERELRKAYEEEEFLMIATQILMSQ